MCAATAAAVGTAVAAVATLGSTAMGAMSGGGSAGSKTQVPQTKPVPGFAPATGLQSYTARLLAANKGVRTPGVLDWAASGGTLRPDWKVPDLTPREAQQLKFVEPGTGKPIPGYSTDVGGPLSPAAQAELGRERVRNLKSQNMAVPARDPQIRYGQLSSREEMLQTRIAERGGVAPGLQKKLTNVQTKKTAVGKRLGF